MSETQTVDLTNCDREPIHIPGSIQPHGALLAVDAIERAPPTAMRAAPGAMRAPATTAPPTPVAGKALCPGDRGGASAARRDTGGGGDGGWGAEI